MAGSVWQMGQWAVGLMWCVGGVCGGVVVCGGEEGGGGGVRKPRLPMRHLPHPIIPF